LPDVQSLELRNYRLKIGKSYKMFLSNFLNSSELLIIFLVQDSKIKLILSEQGGPLSQ
jgi:hypothetical protein